MKKQKVFGFCVLGALAVSAALPWGKAPDGSVWNARASRFQFAPYFEFGEKAGAVSYLNVVIDDFHNIKNIDSKTPSVDLAGVWDSIPVGYVTVVCQAKDAQGRIVGEAGRRQFWKKAAFDAKKYPPGAMSYSLAATRMMDYFVAMPETRHLLKTGEPDLDSYSLNGYPSKMLSSKINAICDFYKNGKYGQADNDHLVDIARKAAEFLVSYSIPAGQPLEYFPRTYHERGSEYKRFVGEQDRIHLLYPAKAGFALVQLYNLTKEKRWLEAAERIAGTYIRLQEKDGTWPMMLNGKTGEHYANNKDNRLVPLEPMLFMEALHDVTKNAKYRESSDKSFKFLENGPLKNWNWEGQFEDGAKSIVKTHTNLSNFPANMMASYLVSRFPGDAKRLAQAEALCRFVEDQFVDWEPPYDNGRSNREYGKTDDGSWKWFCRPTSKWSTPCVLEQYGCYVPVNASAAKTINTLLDVWKASGKDIYLQKARAIADAQTRMIEHDGFLNTWSILGVRRYDHRHHTWINCTMETMSALSRLARETDMRK